MAEPETLDVSAPLTLEAYVTNLSIGELRKQIAARIDGLSEKHDRDLPKRVSESTRTLLDAMIDELVNRANAKELCND